MTDHCSLSTALVSDCNSDTHELLRLLQNLDRLLEKAVAAAEVTYGSEASHSPYRGIQINEAEVERLLDRKPGIPTLAPQETILQDFSADLFHENSRLSWLYQTFGLSNFDLAITAIALAPELDRRYERLYAYLQDDVRSKRPTVDLCLNLLCTSALEKLKQRVHFTVDAPLIRHALLHLIPDPNQTQPSLLSHIVKLDPAVIRLLLEEHGLDERLGSFCQLITPQFDIDNLPLQAEIKQSLPILVKANWQADNSLILYFEGADRSSKRYAAEAIAHSLQVPLLSANLAHILDAKAEVAATLKLLLRETQLQKALLYIDELEAWQTPDNYLLYQSLLNQLAAYPNVAILAGTKPWDKANTNVQGVLTVSFLMPDFEQRRFYWQKYLQAANISLGLSDLDTLSDRFRLTSEQIADAVVTAVNQARWQMSGHGMIDLPSNIQTSVRGRFKSRCGGKKALWCTLQILSTAPREPHE